MRKFLTILLAIMVLFSLCACEKDIFTSGDINSSVNNDATNGDVNANAPDHTHSFSAATCTEPKKCDCGETEGEALGHTFTDATCTAPKTCSVCGATEGNAAGHSWKDATCTAPKTCSVCGATEGNAAGHSWKDATCTAPKTCSVCGTTEGNAAGHSWKDATCTAPKTCSVCGANDGSANGHDYIDGTCHVCNGVQENYKALDTGVWTATQVVNGTLYDINLSFTNPFLGIAYGSNIHSPTFNATFRDQLLQDYEDNKNALTVVDGVYYYCGSGDGGDITYTANGNSIQVNCLDYLHFSITRTAGNQLTITNCDEITALSGVVLTWQEK